MYKINKARRAFNNTHFPMPHALPDRYFKIMLHPKKATKQQIFDIVFDVLRTGYEIGLDQARKEYEKK